MAPDVSVIIPTIGRPTLRRTVQSTLMARLDAVKPIVIVDRPDALPSVTEMLYDLPHQRIEGYGNGPAAARNLGITAAETSHVSFLDDDDVWLPGNAQRHLRALDLAPQSNRTITITYNSWQRANGRIVSNIPRRTSIASEAFANSLVERKKLRFGPVLHNTCNMFIPTRLATETMWDEHLKKFEDWDFWIRIAQHADLNEVFVGGPGTHVQQGSMSSLSKAQDLAPAFYFLDKHAATLSGRAKSDFILLHLVTPTMVVGSSQEMRKSIRLLRQNAVPHSAAVIRAVFGFLQ